MLAGGPIKKPAQYAGLAPEDRNARPIPQNALIVEYGGLANNPMISPIGSRAGAGPTKAAATKVPIVAGPKAGPTTGILATGKSGWDDTSLLGKRTTLGNIMGGKGGGGSSFTPPPQNDGMDQEMLAQLFQGMMGMMGGMMEGFTGQLTALSQQMQQSMTAMPEVQKAPDIDWSEKMQQLQSKSKADFALDAARKKGISNSTYTSPLLDDEEADTTHVSLVAGR
jgi:hypothetical protein